jgi:hypothetical protein
MSVKQEDNGGEETSLEAFVAVYRNVRSKNQNSVPYYCCQDKTYTSLKSE